MRIVSAIPLLLGLGACSPVKPTPIDECRLSGEGVGEAVCLRLPRGVFRGALWPSDHNPNIELWMTDGPFRLSRVLDTYGDEYFFDVPPPEGFFDCGNGGGDFEPDELQAGVYSIDDRRLELPKSPHGYWFTRFRHEDGRQLVLFMNPKEQFEQRGLFGYVVLPGSSSGAELEAPD